jgi:Tfp pilus assembly protein PilF
MNNSSNEHDSIYHIDKAIEKEPNNIKFYKIKCQLQISNQDYTDASVTIEKALKISPNNIDLKSLKEQISNKLGKENKCDYNGRTYLENSRWKVDECSSCKCEVNFWILNYCSK